MEHIPMNHRDPIREFSANYLKILTQLSPGIAILLNGVSLGANREIGVPGRIGR